MEGASPDRASRSCWPDADVAEAGARDVDGLLPGVPGGLGVGHPAACRALSTAAGAAGARYRRGVSRVYITLEHQTEGAVLIGDAAGYNDPLIGQGLSLAMRDVWIVSEILLAHERWSSERFRHYAEERAKRLKRVRFAAALTAGLNATFGAAGAARRHAYLRRLSDRDFRGTALSRSYAIGPDRSPDWVYTEDFRAEVLGIDGP